MLCRCFLLIGALSQGFGQHSDGDAIRFTLYGGAHTWNEALAICLSINGSMLHFHSTNDTELFLKFLDKWRNHGNLANDIWIGLFDNDIPGEDFQFIWDNCHSFIDDGSLWSTSDSTEPNLKETQHCVRYVPRDGFKTKGCTEQYAVVCQQVLDSCWFEVFDMKELNEPDLVGVVNSSLNLDQCKKKCLSMNSPENLCIAFEFSLKCKTYTGRSIYVLDTPAMSDVVWLTWSSSSLHIKRCYGGIYEATPPTVLTSTSSEPSAQCTLTSSTSTSSTTTTTTTTAVSTTSTAIASTTSLTTTPTPTNPSTTTASTTTSPTIPTTSASTSTAMTSSTNPETTNTSSTTDGLMLTSPPASDPCGFSDRECICMEYSMGDLAALEELIASLVLDKKALSSYRRKKTSAPDHRVSAISIGKVGIAIFALVFISIVLLDCSRVFRFDLSHKTRK